MPTNDFLNVNTQDTFGQGVDTGAKLGGTFNNAFNTVIDAGLKQEELRINKVKLEAMKEELQYKKQENLFHPLYKAAESKNPSVQKAMISVFARRYQEYTGQEAPKEVLDMMKDQGNFEKLSAKLQELNTSDPKSRGIVFEEAVRYFGDATKAAEFFETYEKVPASIQAQQAKNQFTQQRDVYTEAKNALSDSVKYGVKIPPGYSELLGNPSNVKNPQYMAVLGSLQGMNASKSGEKVALEDKVKQQQIEQQQASIENLKQKPVVDFHNSIDKAIDAINGKPNTSPKKLEDMNNAAQLVKDAKTELRKAELAVAGFAGTNDPKLADAEAELAKKKSDFDKKFSDFTKKQAIANSSIKETDNGLKNQKFELDTEEKMVKRAKAVDKKYGETLTRAGQIKALINVNPGYEFGSGNGAFDQALLGAYQAFAELKSSTIREGDVKRYSSMGGDWERLKNLPDSISKGVIFSEETKKQMLSATKVMEEYLKSKRNDELAPVINASKSRGVNLKNVLPPSLLGEIRSSELDSSIAKKLQNKKSLMSNKDKLSGMVFDGKKYLDLSKEQKEVIDKQLGAK